ncbi:MAG: glycosyltransferase family 2 protein [Clostridia bacterium]|nr:glycosyltransferase family 2 protein [Clostridia bacterium]
MKLSIILPVYNVAKFIPDCLDSLLCQDLDKKDYEIICVNDGSPDNSEQVINGYIENNSNIKLIAQKNSGVCVARNTGLNNATGDYVWFIDPDDYIAPNCLGKILSSLEEKNADLITFDYFNVEEDSKFNPEKKTEIEIKEQVGYSSKGGVWQYVVKRQYLLDNDIKYNTDLAYGEDYLWAFQINYRKHVGLETNAEIYYYRQRQGSAMHSHTKEKQVRHKDNLHKLALIYREEYARCKRENLPKSVLKNIKRRIHLCVQSVVLDLVRLAETKQELKTELKKMKQEKLYPYPLLIWFIFDKSLSMPKKAKWFALFLSFRWYVILANRLYRKSKKKS